MSWETLCHTTGACVGRVEPQTNANVALPCPLPAFKRLSNRVSPRPPPLTHDDHRIFALGTYVISPRSLPSHGTTEGIFIIFHFSFFCRNQQHSLLYFQSKPNPIRLLATKQEPAQAEPKGHNPSARPSPLAQVGKRERPQRGLAVRQVRQVRRAGQSCCCGRLFGRVCQPATHVPTC